MSFSVENKEPVSAPCLSLWEKWSRAARTEKVNGGAYIDTGNGAYLY